jgi:hypothetical protein
MYQNTAIPNIRHEHIFHQGRNSEDTPNSGKKGFDSTSFGA